MYMSISGTVDLCIIDHCLYILKFRILFSEHKLIFIYSFIYLFIYLNRLKSEDCNGSKKKNKKKKNSQRLSSEQNHKSLISVGLLLN